MGAAPLMLQVIMVALFGIEIEAGPFEALVLRWAGRHADAQPGAAPAGAA